MTVEISSFQTDITEDDYDYHLNILFNDFNKNQAEREREKEETHEQAVLELSVSSDSGRSV